MIVIKKCVFCKTEYDVQDYISKYSKEHFCSQECFKRSMDIDSEQKRITKKTTRKLPPILIKNQYKKGHSPVAGFKKGHVGFKKENSPRWKGDEVGYWGIHSWIKRNYGKASKCEICGVLGAKRYEWASKNHVYTRDISEWTQVCTSCHRKIDGRTKVIVQLDENKNPIKEFSSVLDARAFFGKNGAIYDALKRGKRAHGHYWKYKDV